MHFIGANFESGIGGNGNVSIVLPVFSYKPATLVLFRTCSVLLFFDNLFCLNLVWVLFRHLTVFILDQAWNFSGKAIQLCQNS